MTNDRLEMLYRLYGPAIHARCARILKDEAAAEDATQETFVRVHRHLHKVPDARQALAWIYRIATNYCLNELRDGRARPEPTIELPERASENAEAALADRDLAARLIRRAPEKVRTAAWLHYVDGLDQGEVAEVLGVSRRTVVNLLGTFIQNARKFEARTGS